MLAKIVFSLLCMMVVFCVFGLSKAWAQIAANSVIITQRDATGGSNVNRVLPPPSTNSVVFVDGYTKAIRLESASTFVGATGAQGPAGTPGADGTNATTTATATTSANGLMSSTDKSKLDGVATGATANATNSQLRDRSTHTGAQAISTITGNAVNGTTAKNGAFSIIKSANVASGNAVFHLTADGLSTGAALCSEVQQDSVALAVNDAAASYQIGWAFSNLNKTLTAVVNRLGTANILTGVLGQVAAPNGTPVKLTVLCN